jgi:uncharacterized membrane protein
MLLSLFPLQNPAVVWGLLIVLLAAVFATSSLPSPGWKRFYTFVPSVLLCYLLPSALRMGGLVDDAMVGKVYDVAKNYMLPASLVLMTLGIDAKGLARLGPKSLVMFFTATAGIVIGGPLSVLAIGLLSPETFAAAQPADEVWRGLATLAGSWIGGGANQAAMLEVYGYNPERYSGMVAVDIVGANVLMAFLLYGAGNAARIDRWLGADSSAIDELQRRIEDYRASISRVPGTADLMMVLAAGFGGVALSHLAADGLSGWVAAEMPEWANGTLGSGFFWLVVAATTIGLLLSFTPARRLEGVGASRMGSACIYLLVAAVGMKMDLMRMFDFPWLIALGLLWLFIHISLLLLVAKLIKAPFFFVAVGSKANVGGAASAPVVASAFSPALAPVGVLLAVLGYALGTYGAIVCAMLMQAVSP